MDDILYFSNLSNKKKIIITGKAQREEYEDIPKRALREAISNCFCHRDYSLSGDIKVEYYDDRVMVFSPGSLPDGLTVEDIKNGMTAKRNQILVNALDKADFIEITHQEFGESSKTTKITTKSRSTEYRIME